MEIDLASAPKDATHYKPNNPDMPFRMEDGGSWYAWESDEENWIEIVDPTPGEYLPIDAPWSGEGLPPVGAVCEMRDSDAGAWEAGEVRYISPLMVVMRYKGQTGDIEEASEAKFAQFRPLRTPKQIAADREIEALAKDIMSEQHISGRVLAERLHALGYRKTEGGAA